MSEQDYSEPQEETGASDEIDNDTREPEFDEDTLRSNERRSRFFFAAMSFLLALLCLSAYLNHLTPLNDTILQIGLVFFAAIGIFLLLRGGAAMHERPLSPGEQVGAQPEDRKDGSEEDGSTQPNLTPFELLVQEALAAIPEEFRARMDNVFVQVEYEPGEELLRRVRPLREAAAGRLRWCLIDATALPQVSIRPAQKHSSFGC